MNDPTAEIMALADAYVGACAGRVEDARRLNFVKFDAARAALESRIRSALSERGTACAQAGRLPKEPPPGLLMSMAIRFDHGLGMPGFYDSGIYTEVTGVTHAQRLESTLRTMRQLYEEVSGYGFYKPELEAEYVGIGGAEKE